MKTTITPDPYISLKTGETYTNMGSRKDVQILYFNSVGIKQTSFKVIETGQSITKTDNCTIIHIFLT
jgi:hypothetical protein